MRKPLATITNAQAAPVRDKTKQQTPALRGARSVADMRKAFEAKAQEAQGHQYSRVPKGPAPTRAFFTDALATGHLFEEEDDAYCSSSCGGSPMLSVEHRELLPLEAIDQCVFRNNPQTPMDTLAIRVEETKAARAERIEAEKRLMAIETQVKNLKKEVKQTKNSAAAKKRKNKQQQKEEEIVITAAEKSAPEVTPVKKQLLLTQAHALAMDQPVRNALAADNWITLSTGEVDSLEPLEEGDSFELDTVNFQQLLQAPTAAKQRAAVVLTPNTKKQRMFTLKVIEKETRKETGETMLAKRNPISATDALARKISRPEKLRMLRAVSTLQEEIDSPSATMVVLSTDADAASEPSEALVAPAHETLASAPMTPIQGKFDIQRSLELALEDFDFDGDDSSDDDEDDMESFSSPAKSAPSFAMVEEGAEREEEDDDDEEDEEDEEEESSSELSSSSEESFDEDQQLADSEEFVEENAACEKEEEIFSAASSTMNEEDKRRLKSYIAKTESREKQLTYVMEDKNLSNLFREYLRRDNYEFMMTFLEEVEQMKRATSAPARIGKARSIFRAFLTQNGTESLISPHYAAVLHMSSVIISVIQLSLEAADDNISDSVFQVSEGHVTNALAKHFLPHFVESDLYKTFAPGLDQPKSRPSVQQVFSTSSDLNSILMDSGAFLAFVAHECSRKDALRAKRNLHFLNSVRDLAAGHVDACSVFDQFIGPQAPEPQIDLSDLRRQQLASQFDSNASADFFEVAVTDVERSLNGHLIPMFKGSASAEEYSDVSLQLDSPSIPSPHMKRAIPSLPVPDLEYLLQNPQEEHAQALMRFAKELGRGDSHRWSSAVYNFKQNVDGYERAQIARRLLDELKAMERIPPFFTEAMESKFEAWKKRAHVDFFDTALGIIERTVICDTYDRYNAEVSQSHPQPTMMEDDFEEESSFGFGGPQTLRRIQMETERRRQEELEMSSSDEDTIVLRPDEQQDSSIGMSSTGADSYVAAGETPVAVARQQPQGRQFKGDVTLNNSKRFAVLTGAGELCFYKAKGLWKLGASPLTSLQLRRMESVSGTNQSVALTFPGSQVFILGATNCPDWKLVLESWLMR